SDAYCLINLQEATLEAIKKKNRPPMSQNVGRFGIAFGKHWKEKNVTWARFEKKRDKNTTLQDFDGALDLHCVEKTS
ncbi:hypothetical protein Tco_0050304, partial [Tanacetum coccineum]